jgi:hypothetical protein
MYKIESGVALPDVARHSTRKGSTKYPFAEMNVGQSFLIPATSEDEVVKVESRLRGATLRYAKQQGGTVKFTVRAVNDGIRVWRVA